MNTPETPIGDHNIERLVGVAYKPDVVDSAFAQNVEEHLCFVGHQLAQSRSTHKPESPGLTRLQRRLSWVTGLAACVAICGLVWYARIKSPGHVPEEHVWIGSPDIPAAARKTPSLPSGMTARPRSDGKAVKPLDIGETLATKAGERRRVPLADGSILFVNQDTQIKQVDNRQIELSKGEVYLEVAPRENAKGPSFVVKTPKGEVSAFGTRFVVRTGTQGTGVVVTQGKVQVSGQTVEAGQEVAPGSQKVSPAPRASHVLDWTRDLVAAAESPLVPANKHAGGALLAVDPNGQEVQLSLRKFLIDVHIEDGFARTTIDQTYFNNLHSRLEGTFYFPLPPDAVLSRLAMYVEENGEWCKIMEGGMAEREHARNVFETIRYTNRDPALLEWVDGSTFRMRVFPLEGRKEKRIILSYTQRLNTLYGVTSYRFPGGLNMENVGTWQFQGRINNASDLRITSPTHPKIEVKNEGKDKLLLTSAHDIKPDKDVWLEIAETDAARLVKVVEATRFSRYEHEGHEYLMVRYRPLLPAMPKSERRDWVFLYESAANRDPLLARAQIEIVRTLLENAGHGDTFTLMTAGTRVQTFDQNSRPVNPGNIAEAVRFLESTHLIGALDLEKAIQAALPLAKAVKNPHIVHLGAGVAAIGERREDALAKMIPESIRYVGVGVGKRWSRLFMKMAAERTGGYFTQINPDESINWRTFELLATLNTARLLDVRVVDNVEKATFLTESVYLAQGEELCAITRVASKGGSLPKSISISGRLDGRAFTEQLEVKNVVDNAGYLPRQWAKHEIDRLLADDGEKNKQRIIELSKAMYVMSPYTSLLVLETEEDYKRFNVDRGRKDHWALYSCEPRIKNVYEPDPNWVRPIPKVETGERRPIEEVLQTVLVHIPPQVWASSNNPHRGWPAVATALQVYAGAVAMPVFGDIDDRFLNFSAEGFSFRGRSAGRARLLEERESAGSLLGALKKRLGGVEMERMGEDRRENRLSLLSDLVAGSDDFAGRRSEPMATTATRELLREQTRMKHLTQLMAGSGGGEFGGFRGGMGKSGFGGARGTRPVGMPGSGPAPGLSGTGRGLNGRLGYFNQIPALELALDELQPMNEGLDRKARSERVMEEMTSRLVHGWSRGTILYERPTFTGDHRVFDDLLVYAPGMHNTSADIQAVLEREAKLDQRPAEGKVDAAARALIEKARAAGWQCITYPAEGKSSEWKLFANGAGHFAYERVLATGLREQVICDDSTLLHLYPEIGLGSRRSLTRFHREEFTNLIPWYLPAVEDLAIGADVRLLDEATIAIIAHQTAPSSKKKDVTYEVRLRFSKDGRLTERQGVEMPSGKVIYRETYDANGNVQIVLGEEKREIKLTVAPAEAPDLRPETRQLVVVPMPVRTREYEHGRMKNFGGNYSNMDEDHAIALIASESLQHTGTAMQVFGERFHAKGDQRLGFYVLLAAGHVHLQPNQVYHWNKVKVKFDIAAEHPKNALAKYLAHRNIAAYQGYRQELGAIEGPKDGFIQQLAAFRDTYHRWTQGRVNQGNQEQRTAEHAKTMAIIKESKSPMQAWILLDILQRYGGINTPELFATAAQVYGSHGDPLGMTYAARYELARAQLNAGQQDAARRAFSELYQESRKAGDLPLVDHSFRQALQNNNEYAELMRRTASELLQAKKPEIALILAWQNWQLGDHPLSDEIYNLALSGSAIEDNDLRLVALQYLCETGQWPRADSLLQQLLADDKLTSRAPVWRLGAAINQRRGMLARSVACLEKAMELEYQNLPEAINLQVVRQDYQGLLSHYQQLALAVSILDAEPPQEFLAKVVRAADRWRSLDPDATTACHLAAKSLQALGAKELAWDYLTTPIGQKPNEAAPWLSLAQTLRGDGELQLADRAFAMAYLAEPTNAQILWERAQNLQQGGKVHESRQLYRQLADGSWQPRFQWIQNQARMFLNRN